MNIKVTVQGIRLISGRTELGSSRALLQEERCLFQHHPAAVGMYRCLCEQGFQDAAHKVQVFSLPRPRLIWLADNCPAHDYANSQHP